MAKRKRPIREPSLEEEGDASDQGPPTASNSPQPRRSARVAKLPKKSYSERSPAGDESEGEDRESGTEKDENQDRDESGDGDQDEDEDEDAPGGSKRRKTCNAPRGIGKGGKGKSGQGNAKGRTTGRTTSTTASGSKGLKLREAKKMFWVDRRIYVRIGGRGGWIEGLVKEVRERRGDVWVYWEKHGEGGTIRSDRVRDVKLAEEKSPSAESTSNEASGSG
ncbi:hypothetical protein FA13DRAFT_1805570 [Coprinellus micaceus]|uniref:Uncharacterized protein n=1 Tax=Coprinellus micaceus TaxID=71717 RepID=A0A4Y7RZG4_COPMI|nr:hypothetical protein FA13DRAFT_1805570 [Coprinellus micaceus]